MSTAVTARRPLKVVAALSAGSWPISLPRPCAGRSHYVREHGALAWPRAVAAIVQGRLSGSQIAEAGLSVQPKGPKAAEKAEAAA